MNGIQGPQILERILIICRDKCRLSEPLYTWSWVEVLVGLEWWTLTQDIPISAWANQPPPHVFVLCSNQWSISSHCDCTPSQCSRQGAWLGYLGKVHYKCGKGNLWCKKLTDHLKWSPLKWENVNCLSNPFPRVKIILNQIAQNIWCCYLMATLSPAVKCCLATIRILTVILGLDRLEPTMQGFIVRWFRLHFSSRLNGRGWIKCSNCRVVMYE